MVDTGGQRRAVVGGEHVLSASAASSPLWNEIFDWSRSAMIEVQQSKAKQFKQQPLDGPESFHVQTLVLSSNQGQNAQTIDGAIRYSVVHVTLPWTLQ